jgi:diguanylate cyclase (GGDEF)-like protein
VVFLKFRHALDVREGEGPPRPGPRRAGPEEEASVEGMKRGITFFIPGGILFFAALLMANMDALRGFIPAVVGMAPYVVFTAAVLIGWRFNRSALVFSVLILGFCGAVLHLIAGSPAGLSPRTETAYHAMAFLIPVNLLVLSLMKERGIFTFHGVFRLSLILLQPVTIAGLSRLHAPAMLGYLKARPIPLAFLDSLAISQPALVVSILACAVVGLRFVLRQGAKESGFFWAIFTLLTGFLTAGPGGVLEFYFTVAGFILLVSLIEASHAMAFKDELTGLPARRALKEDLLKLGHRYALAMVDIDHFKKFNDTYGHDVGDQVLRMVAAKLARVSGGGKSFRYGGEEFTVIFPGRYADHARAHLEGLRREIASSAFIIRGSQRPRKKPKSVKASKAPLKSVSVTVSIGVACRDEKHGTPQAVIKAADKALYRAKKGGRNQVCS